MQRFGRGFRFLSSASASQRVEWDPTVSLALKHATLILLEKCSTRDHFKQILAQIMRTNLIGQTFPMSRLILFSAITHPENLDMAVLLFRHHTPHPNLYIYNTMISALSLSLNQSFAFYNSLLSSCIYPDRSTFLFLLQASKFLSQVMQIHCHAIITGSFSYGYLQNTLIKMYLENEKMGLAYQVFQQMAAPDAVSFNIMIFGYAKKGHNIEALKFLHEMVGLGLKPDEFTMLGLLICCGRLGDAQLGKSVHAWIERRGLIKSSNLILNNALLDMYVKCKELRIAQSIFNVIVRKDTISWNTMIAGYAKVGNLEIAHNFFEDMPCRDLVSWNSIIAGYAQKGDCLMFLLLRRLELCTMVDGSMVGWEVTEKDVTVWTTMITGFAFHGYGSKALQLFYEMQEYVMPNQYEGRYGIEPGVEHYGCLVDLLGRSGRFSEVKDVIEMMPMKPSRSIWGAVLSACRAYGNIEIAEIAGKELLKLEPEKEGGYVLLSNIYATSGRWKHSDKIREIMESRGVKKTAGCSSVVVDGIIHEFVAADKRHPRWIEIQSILFCLKSEMKLGTDFLLEYLQPWCSC
ncbi:Pentatricopeptide repeat-containing protein, mitochondrial [Vitis vinifera]|uniref:Pentatricopeptide repeat-containing protein, mitochondrial n=1 Tax=Vitis vinifera TaxID=29760 RepID=A0A438IH02_VITVI|nr:Pentatricopeptide repeat-containing protein, mitochondrial [Vitis vinifera]